MRPKRALRVLAIITGLIGMTLLVLSWHLQHSFSLAIRWKVQRACHARRPCVFSLGEVLPGKWDRIVVFELGTSEDEIESAVGKSLPQPDLQRLIVFMNGQTVVRSVTETEDFERPDTSDIIFDHVSVIDHHFTINRDTRFVMVKGVPSCDECTSLQQLNPGEIVE
jgi:hypothetical protein